MKKVISAYGEVLRLVRRLPEDSRIYYAKYARENFVNYREVDPNDATALQELLTRTYKHSLWVLKKAAGDAVPDEVEAFVFMVPGKQVMLPIQPTQIADIGYKLLSDIRTTMHANIKPPLFKMNVAQSHS
ncbi:hypothetical protein AgCh_001319 [Apium graveolens]